MPTFPKRHKQKKNKPSNNEEKKKKEKRFRAVLSSLLDSQGTIRKQENKNKKQIRT